MSISDLRPDVDNIKDRYGTGRITDKYDGLGILFILPVVVTFVLVTIIPVAYGIWLSLQSGQGVNDLQWTGLGNYRTLFGSAEFYSSLVTGLIYAIYAVTLQVIVGTAVALSLNRVEKFSSVFRAIIFLPYMIPTIAVAVVFRMMINTDIGVLNWFLIQMGLVEDGINFLALDTAMHTVVLASTWKWSIFVVILVLARLQSIDQTQYEMAKTNGANTFRQFADITYPNIKSVLFLVVLLRSIWMFNKFDMIWLLTGGGPLGETTTAVILAYQRAFGEFNFGESAAITTVMFVILIMFGIVYFKVFSPEDEVEVKQ